MKLRTAADAAVRQPPLPDSPVISVFFGGADDPGDLGLLKVAVPAGAGMPPHRHHGSDVILIPVAGFVRIVKGEEAIDVYPGDAAFIDKDEAVSLTNPGNQDAGVRRGRTGLVRTHGARLGGGGCGHRGLGRQGPGCGRRSGPGGRARG